MDSEHKDSNRKTGGRGEAAAVEIETSSAEVEAEVWVFHFEALGIRQNLLLDSESSDALNLIF